MLLPSTPIVYNHMLLYLIVTKKHSSSHPSRHAAKSQGKLMLLYQVCHGRRLQEVEIAFLDHLPVIVHGTGVRL